MAKKKSRKDEIPPEEITTIEGLAEQCAKLRHQLAVHRLRAELMGLVFDVCGIQAQLPPHLRNLEIRRN